MGAKEIFNSLAQLDGSKSREDRQKNALALLEFSYQHEERIARRETADYTQDVKELENVFTKYKTQMGDASLDLAGIAQTEKAFNEDVVKQKEHYNITEGSDLENYFDSNVSGINEIFQIAKRGQELGDDYYKVHSAAQALYKDDAYSGKYNEKDAEDVLANINTLSKTGFDLGYDKIVTSLDAIRSNVMKKRQVIGRLGDIDFNPDKPFLQSRGDVPINPNHLAAQQSAKWGDWDTALKYLNDGTASEVDLINASAESAYEIERQVFNKIQANISKLATGSSLSGHVTNIISHPTTKNNWVHWGRSQDDNPVNTSMLRLFDEIERTDNWKGSALEGVTADLTDEGKALYLSGQVYYKGKQWIYTDDASAIYQDEAGTILNPYGSIEHNWDNKRIEENIGAIKYDFSKDTIDNDRLLISEISKQFLDTHQSTIWNRTKRLEIPDESTLEDITGDSKKIDETEKLKIPPKLAKSLDYLSNSIKDDKDELSNLESLQRQGFEIDIDRVKQLSIDIDKNLKERTKLSNQLDVDELKIRKDERLRSIDLLAKTILKENKLKNTANNVRMAKQKAAGLIRPVSVSQFEQSASGFQKQRPAYDTQGRIKR